jgi:hypothetical protein
MIFCHLAEKGSKKSIAQAADCFCVLTLHSEKVL